MRDARLDLFHTSRWVPLGETGSMTRDSTRPGHWLRGKGVDWRERLAMHSVKLWLPGVQDDIKLSHSPLSTPSFPELPWPK